MSPLKAELKRFLGRRESALIARDSSPRGVPVFIIAPPRSGSTLLYQCMATLFRFCYTSNGMQRFPYCPALFARTVPSAIAFKPGSGFRNKYGFTGGFSEPSDGYALWARWFPEHPHYLEPGDVSTQSLDEMRSTILAIQRFAHAPFLNKSQRNALRASVLDQCFPEAVFVRMKRAHPSLILSLYKAHVAHQGGEWFSVRPREFESIADTESAIERAVLHAAHAELDIVDQLALIPGNRVIETSYEQLCADPHTELRRIEDRYRASGWTLTRRGSIPERFSVPDTASEDEAVLREIGQYMEKHSQLFERLEQDVPHQSHLDRESSV